MIELNQGNCLTYSLFCCTVMSFKDIPAMVQQRSKKSINSFAKKISEKDLDINRMELCCSRTRRVPKIAEIMVMKGIKRIITEIRSDVSVFRRPTAYADTIQQQALINRERALGQQASFKKAYEAIRTSPEQRRDPHFGVVIFDRDMAIDEDTQVPYVYGAGHYPHIILSIRRFVHKIRNSTQR